MRAFASICVYLHVWASFCLHLHWYACICRHLHQYARLSIILLHMRAIIAFFSDFPTSYNARSINFNSTIDNRFSQNFLRLKSWEIELSFRSASNIERKSSINRSKFHHKNELFQHRRRIDRIMASSCVIFLIGEEYSLHFRQNSYDFLSRHSKWYVSQGSKTQN